MKNRENISALGYALLGLIAQTPQSGYQLLRVFKTTPMGSYSSSPGAIYPALQKLEKQKLVTAKNEKSGKVRVRRVFRVTSYGKTLLFDWLRLPITKEDALRQGDQLMLRFAFSDALLSCVEVLSFLQQFALAYSQAASSIEDYLANETHLSSGGRLAVELGKEELRSRENWAKRAYKTLSS